MRAVRGRKGGTEGGHCYGNGTCNIGLACFSNLCVDPNPIDGSAATGGRGTGGASGTGRHGRRDLRLRRTMPVGVQVHAVDCGQAQSCISSPTAEAQQRDRHPLHDRQLVVDDRDAAEALPQLPNFMNVLQGLPTPPSLHIAVVSSDMGAPGDVTSSIRCTTTGTRAVPEHAARNLHEHDAHGGATFISDADMTPNYTGPISRCSSASRSLGDKGAGSSTSSPRSTARSAPTDRPRPARTPASSVRRLPRHRHPDQRGRLLGARQHRALLSERRPAEHRQPARPHRQLPLQPVVATSARIR